MKRVSSKVNKECAIKSLSAAKDGSFPSEWRPEFELAGPQALVGRLGRGQDVVRQVASETFPPLSPLAMLHHGDLVVDNNAVSWTAGPPDLQRGSWNCNIEAFSSSQTFVTLSINFDFPMISIDVI